MDVNEHLLNTALQLLLHLLIAFILLSPLEAELNSILFSAGLKAEYQVAAEVILRLVNLIFLHRLLWNLKLFITTQVRELLLLLKE